MEKQASVNLCAIKNTYFVLDADAVVVEDADNDVHDAGGWPLRARAGLV
jgi:hypothetical protein